MPDLRPYDVFRRRLTRIERELVRGLLSDYRDMRREMLDAVSRMPLTDPRLMDLVSRDLEHLAAQATRAGREKGPEIQAAVTSYTAGQLENLKRAGLPVPDMTRLITVEAEQVQAIEQVFALPAWMLTIRGRMLSTLNRAGTMDPDLAERQLLGVDLVDGRASAYRAGKNTMELGVQQDVWTAASLAIAKALAAVETITGTRYDRQAVAAIDEKTTDCCLRVHGQVARLEEPFHLAGVPRFADYVMHPPFHWYCRTSVSLYHVRLEEVGVSTETMRDAARAELDARAITGKRVEIHPSHSTSRR